MLSSANLNYTFNTRAKLVSSAGLHYTFIVYIGTLLVSSASLFLYIYNIGTTLSSEDLYYTVKVFKAFDK